jgi:Protein of unknown function (DUF2750)
MDKLSVSLGLTRVLDVETRISRRVPVSMKEIEALSAASAESRQRYMLNEIVYRHEVWTVFDGDELPTFKSTQNDVLHAWPHREFALKFHSQTITKPFAVPIPINDWIDMILFDEQQENLDVAYFPVGTGSAVVMTDRETFLALVLEKWFDQFGNHTEFDLHDQQGSISRMIAKAQNRNLLDAPKGRLP